MNGFSPTTCLAIALVLSFAACASGLAGTRGLQRSETAKLGQAKVDAKVFAKPDLKSAVLEQLVKAGSYVVIRDIGGEWATVVMATGREGFMLLSQLEVLTYQVNIRSDGLGGERREIGRINAVTSIYSEPNKGARKIGELKKGRHVKVFKRNADWVTIIMDDHSGAYVPRSAVAILWTVTKTDKFVISPTAVVIKERTGVVTSTTKLFTMPNKYSAEVADLKAGSTVSVLSVDDEFIFIDSYTKLAYVAVETTTKKRGFALLDRIDFSGGWPP
jgi:hypothetical protein